VDYFQGVVQEYLRAGRTRFVNSECLIQLNAGSKLAKNDHWYCDFLTVDFAEHTAYLCEVSFARNSYALLKRLDEWHANWERVRQAVFRDCQIPDVWKVGIWIFLPKAMEAALRRRARFFHATSDDCPIKVETLENVLPWKYRSWNGQPYDSTNADI
jgi:hypothetical protein